MAVVTGGSGGIGGAICSELAAGGAFVYCGYHSREGAVAELRERAGEAGSRIEALALDVTDPADVERTFKKVATERGRFDILVHAAGASSDGLLLRARPQQVRDQLAINLESAISCARASLPAMLKARYGRIVLIGSVVASIGNTGQSVYAAAKAGVEGFVRSLAREVGNKAVTVNCVAPGFVETEMTATMDEARRNRVLEATAVGRFGTAADVAHAAAFLCDEASGYVTGVVLHVNGGMYM